MAKKSTADKTVMLKVVLQALLASKTIFKQKRMVKRSKKVMLKKVMQED